MYKKIDFRRLIISISLFILGEFSIYMIDQVILNNKLIPDRFILFSLFSFLIALHGYFKKEKLWNFIFKKRYIIGLILFSFIVINGYNGSSIAVYEEAVQPSYREESNYPFLGEYRAIRSDEYLVDTPAIFSQAISNKDFDKINKSLMNRDSLVTLFPLLPTKSFSILLRPQFLGYLFLPLENAFSFAWFLPYFLLFFGLFELFRYLTKDKRMYSLFGAIALTFSPGILWWGAPLTFIYGILATLCFIKFLKADSGKMRLLFSVLLGWMGACYIGTVYPAWMIPYGYIFLALFIWAWYQNWKEKRWKNRYLLYVFPVIAVIAGLFIPVIMENKNIIDLMGKTVYPGSRASTGGSGWQLLYLYMPSVLYPVKAVSNASEFSQIISLYPLPIILGVYQSFKNLKAKKNDGLLNMLLLVTIGLSIWNYVDIGFLSKLTMLSMSTPSRSQLICSVSCTFLLVILIANYHGNYKLNFKKETVKITLSILTVLMGIYASKMIIPEYMDLRVIVLIILPFFIFSYLFLTNSKKTNILLMGALSLVFLIQGLTVNPVTKGIGALYDKPVFKEIRSIVAEDNTSTWMTANAPLQFQSAALANGARVANSTNYYPNFGFWKKLDPEKKYEDIYNRYAHVVVNMTNNETTMENTTPDLVVVNMNVDKLKTLKINYLFSTDNSLENMSTNEVKLKLIYTEDGSNIYKIIYS